MSSNDNNTAGLSRATDDTAQEQANSNQADARAGAAANRPVYPLIDPSKPDSPICLTGPSGAPCASYLSPAEQRAQWLATQEERRAGADDK
ncbi:hypothetical protein JCM3770_002145 [Rhodotorula araucariae]